MTERFWAKVDKSGDCWLWTAGTNSWGYGAFSVAGRMVGAHRFAYELIVGPIPAGKELDRRASCPKRCINPGHLRITTRKQNQENLAVQSNNTSGVRGVSWHRRSGKWTARVKHNQVTYSAGYFDAVRDAEVAAIALRNRLFTHNDLDRETAA